MDYLFYQNTCLLIRIFLSSVVYLGLYYFALCIFCLIDNPKFEAINHAGFGCLQLLKNLDKPAIGLDYDLKLCY